MNSELNDDYTVEGSKMRTFLYIGLALLVIGIIVAIVFLILPSKIKVTPSDGNYMQFITQNFTKGNANLNITYNLVSIAGMKYERQCLIDCNLPISIKYEGASAPATYTLDSIPINKLGLRSYEGVKVYWLNISNVTINDYDTYACFPYNYTNETDTYHYENCSYVFSGTHNKPVYEWISLDSSPITFRKGQISYLNFQGNFKPALGSHGVDVIPNLKVGALNVNMTEYAWWNSTWLNRTEVNVSGGANTLINFTVTMNVSYLTGMGNSTNANGFDTLRFADGNCTGGQNFELDYEFKNISDGKYAIVRVKVPILNPGIKNTSICMYFNNPTAANGEDRVNAWDANYTSVWTLREGTGVVTVDSKGVSNGNFGTGTKTPAWNETSCFIGTCVHFDGGDYITMTNDGTYNLAYVTLEAYQKDDLKTDSHTTVGKPYTTGTGWDAPYQSYAIDHGTHVNIAGSYDGNSAWASYADGQVALTVSGTAHNSWNNGTVAVNDAKSGAILSSGNANFSIGVNSVTSSTSTYFKGMVNEVRLSTGARSADWLNQSYHYFINYNNLVVFGASQAGEASPDTTPPTVTLTAPAPYANVTSADVTFTYAVSDNVNVTNSTIFVWNTTSIINSTFKIAGNSSIAYSYIITVPRVGIYNWSVEATDNMSLITRTANRTFNFTIPDTTAPSIKVFYPNGSIDYYISGNNLSVNYSITDDVGVSACWIDPALPGCIQEYANQTSSCGGLATGGYWTETLSNNWNDAVRVLYDGDYATSTYAADGKNATLYINYTKPANSVGANWIIKAGGGPTNFSYAIPPDCWNYDATKLTLSLTSFFNYAGSTTQILWACRNSSNSWNSTLIETTSTFYEEAMNWSMVRANSYSPKTTLPCTANYSFIPNAYTTATYYASDGAGNIGNATVDWDYKVKQNSVSYSASVIALSSESYNINITYNTTKFPSASVALIYNGTSYSSTATGTGDTKVFNTTLIVPSSGIDTSYPLLWNITLNSTLTLSSPSYTQTIQNSSVFWFALCNGTYTQNSLNITFMDELTGIALNATMDASSFAYTYGSEVKALTFVNTTHNLQYSFCISPASISLKNQYTLQYSHSEGSTYPQRKVYYNETLNNVTTIKNLYLLNLNNGVTSTYQVLTVGGQVIPNTYVEVRRTISGSSVMIESGYTDSAGTISFFLNPNYDHTITATAPGYSSQTVTIKPTQSLYTITMGSSSTYFNYTNPLEGISYTKFPPSGIVQNGLYNFTFQVYARTAVIYNCSFYIYYPNRTLLTSEVGCTSGAPNTGGLISKMINMTGKTSLYGGYYVATSSGTIRLEGDARWVNVQVNNTAYWTSIRSALNDSIYLPEWGDDPQTTDFSRILFFFLGLAIILAILNFSTGYDTAYPGSFLYVVTAIVIIGSAINGIPGPGYFYLNGATNHTFFGDFSSIIDNWILAVHFVMISLIYFFTTNKRYQAG